MRACAWLCYAALLPFVGTAPAIAQAPTELPQPTVVTRVTVQPQQAGGALVTIEALAPVRYSTFRLAPTEELPERLVVDIPDATFAPGYLEQHVGSAGIIGVRASQFTSVPPAARVVLDLLEAGPIRVLTSSPAQVIRIAVGSIDEQPETPVPADQIGAPPGAVEQRPPSPPELPGPEDQEHTWGVPGAARDSGSTRGEGPPRPCRLRAVHVLPGDGEHLELRLDLDGASDPVVFLYGSPAALVLDIPNATPDMTALTPDGIARIAHDPMPGLRWIAVCEVPSPTLTSSRIVVRLDRPVPYDLVPDRRERFAWRLSLRLLPPLRGVVVVDPGHGGRDPGALGALDTVEADQNLLIARRLRSELMARGIATILTRTADTTVDLFHRSWAANELEADLFLSIHLNKGSPDVGGTETFYTSESSKWFAQLIQSAVVRATGLPDRGVKPARYVVTRETEMPSALCEVAFIDAAKQALLVQSEGFQQKVAVALADAVERALSRRSPAPPSPAG